MLIDRGLLQRAFEAIGAALAARGRVGELAVYRGSCLMLVSDFRQSTDDVDAVFLAEAAMIRSIAEQVGRRLALPDGWLNQAVKMYAPPKGQPPPNLFPFGEYPEEGPVGLRVFVPAPDYLLAMKLIANRAAEDTAKLQSDGSDIVSLMALTGKTSFEDLSALLNSCFPRIPGLTEGRIAPRLNAHLLSLIDAFNAARPAARPAWNAPRGAPTREGGE
jgi:hypothetical protein